MQESLFDPFNHHENCQYEGKLEHKSFSETTITYCPKCFATKFTHVECEHTYKTLLVTNSNGSIHVRRYCNKCHHLQAGIKKSDFKPEELNRLPKRTRTSMQAMP